MSTPQPRTAPRKGPAAAAAAPEPATPKPVPVPPKAVPADLPQIKHPNLASALSAAQGQIKNAAKDSENPFFNSRYADLASVLAACRAALAANGLAITQAPGELRELKVGDEALLVLPLTATLFHELGERIDSTLTVPISRPHRKTQDGEQATNKPYDAQTTAAAITYARRVQLSAIIGVAPADDDDGERAVGRGAARGADGRPDWAARKTGGAAPAENQRHPTAATPPAGMGGIPAPWFLGGDMLPHCLTHRWALKLRPDSGRGPWYSCGNKTTEGWCNGRCDQKDLDAQLQRAANAAGIRAGAPPAAPAGEPDFEEEALDGMSGFQRPTAQPPTAPQQLKLRIEKVYEDGLRALHACSNAADATLACKQAYPLLDQKRRGLLRLAYQAHINKL